MSRTRDIFYRTIGILLTLLMGVFFLLYVKLRKKLSTTGQQIDIRLR